MDIYLFGFIIIAFGSLVVTVLVMYSHSHKLQSTITELENELNSMYQCHASETNPWELADTLNHKLQLSQQARELQQKQINELQEELEDLQKELVSVHSYSYASSMADPA
jgi:peptidoglycan hydrolase CwlO-like protein